MKRQRHPYCQEQLLTQLHIVRHTDEWSGQELAGLAMACIRKIMLRNWNVKMHQVRTSVAAPHGCALRSPLCAPFVILRTNLLRSVLAVILLFRFFVFQVLPCSACLSVSLFSFSPGEKERGIGEMIPKKEMNLDNRRESRVVAGLISKWPMDTGRSAN